MSNGLSATRANRRQPSPTELAMELPTLEVALPRRCRIGARASWAALYVEDRPRRSRGYAVEPSARMPLTLVM